MAAKAKAKKTAAPAAETNGHSSTSVGELIPIGQLQPSPTNPRKRFPEESIEELATSIREQGVIEPLIVRKVTAGGDGISHEIVCGERRYRASSRTNLERLPCIVRDLTDDQVLDIQIHENLHREDVHPMDEAYGYQFLQDKLNCNTAELAIRVGKTERYVATRLKLNTLIEEAQKDIEAGHLPLIYALEIAKYAPEAQKLILDNGAYQTDSKFKNGGWVYFPIKGKTKPFGDLLQYINKNILWQLSAAPFDLKATNLRKDGVACVTCPDRTGANVGLFDGNLVGKKDACLNSACFQRKSEQHIVITRERIAHESSIDSKLVPVINLESWQDSKESLGKYSYMIAGKKPYKSFNGEASEKTCDKSVTAVNISDGQFGKTYTVCLKSSGCKTHYPGQKATPAKTSKNAEAEREAELIKKRERREELFDVKVGEIVRTNVFRQAAEVFANDGEIGADIEHVLPQLLTKLWSTSNNGDDSNTLSAIIQPIMRDATDSPKGFDWSRWGTDNSTQNGISKLTLKNQMLMLFLFVHGNTGCMYYDGYKSQKGVKAIAEEYQLDYRLIDAQVRVQVAEEKAKKHLDSFKAYLTAVEAGDSKAKIPRPFAPTYKVKD